MILDILVGTLLLTIPAAVNGYPFVFSDTGTYLLQALELQGAPDRPPYYGLLILPLHLGLSLWPVAIAQAALAAATIRVSARLLVPGLGRAANLALFAALAGLTSLPWHTGQILPDTFAGLIPLFVFLIAYGWDGLGRATRLALLAATAGAVATHQSYLPVALALFGAAAALRRWQGFTRRDAARVAVSGAAVCALAVSAFLAYSLALIHRPTLSPHGSIFLMARLVADGPGLEYLRETCPASGNPFCRHLGEIGPDPVVFLWDREAPLARLTRELGAEPVRRAASEVVAGAIAAHPGEVASAALANAALQLGRFATLDEHCPSHCGPGTGVDAAISHHFGSEYARFRASRQMRAEWPVEAINRLHFAVVLAAAFAAAAALAARRGDRAWVGFGALVVTALVANAFVTGALSGPYDRYQSRVIWLVPLTALLGLLAAGRREITRP